MELELWGLISPNVSANIAVYFQLSQLFFDVLSNNSHVLIVEKKLRKRRNSGRPTIADVAQMAGVSAISVSRALSNPNKVSLDIKQRVEKAVEEIGYIPDPNARALASAQSNIIGVIIPSLSNNVFDDVLKGVYTCVAGTDYNIQIGNYRYDQAEEERLVKLFISQRPAALIITGLDQNPNTTKILQKCKIPIVQIMDFVENPIDMLVGFDQVAATKVVAKHLTEQGFKHIASISARMDSRVKKRVSAFNEQLQQNGLFENELHVTTVEASSVSLGKRLALELLANNPQIDAIFCHNDDLALGSLAACLELGLKTPNQVAIAGFNDLDYMHAMHPALTSMKTHRYDIGFKAVEMAIATVEDERPKQKIINTGYALIARASTIMKP